MISEDIESYCRDHSSPEPEVLAELNRETHLTQVYPRMISGPAQGTLLRFISTMIKPSRILEIGTFTGYSAISLAMGSEAIVHTIEVNPELEPVIRKYISTAALDRRIVLHTGEAEKIIPSLKEQWDLVYIDADKPNYLKYYHQVFPNVRPGGWILADNALWDGKVMDAAITDKETAGIREFNDYIQQDERVENLLLPFRDGIMMIRKRLIP